MVGCLDGYYQTAARTVAGLVNRPSQAGAVWGRRSVRVVTPAADLQSYLAGRPPAAQVQALAATQVIVLAEY